MAEIIAKNTGKRKSIAPRVDLTPMVDLGFLLITFFMFTTSLTTPNAMEINVPDNTPTDVRTSFIDTATITIIPTKENKIAYYYGQLTSEQQIEIVTAIQLRPVIADKQQKLKQLPSSFSEEAHKLHVIIKPNYDSKYEDLVNVLDEMTINAVPYYALTEISDYERYLVTKSLQ